jgi:hypothetical protein
VNKKSFETILDQFTEHWYMGSEPPIVTGKYKNSYVSRPIEEGGYPQIVEFKKYPKYCHQCHTSLETDLSLIDLRDKTQKYRCGCKLPISLGLEKQLHK